MKFIVVDLTGKKTPAELLNYAAAQQAQFREDYAACYDGDGIADEVTVGAAMSVGAMESATSVLSRVQSTVPIDHSPILIWPHVPKGGPDGAIGVHDRLADGRPVCNIYDDLATKYGDAWTSVGSHEALETRADPRLHACVEFDNGEIWDREICDRVEDDTYVKNGVVLSNFNTPACFEPMPQAAVHAAELADAAPAPASPAKAKPREKYDFLGKSTRPNEVRPGGYAQRFDPSQGWVQVGAMRAYRAHLAELGLTRNSKRKARHGHR